MNNNNNPYSFLNEDLRKLLQDSAQARQNFEYAEYNYIPTAVYQLKLAETALDAYISEHRREVT